MNGLDKKPLASAISVVVALLTLASTGNAACYIFLSDKGYGEGATLANPEFNVWWETASVYLWVRPDPNQALIGVGLDVQSDNTAVAEATAVTVFQADIMDGVVDIDDRWKTPIGQGAPGDLVTDMVGVAVETAGIDPANRGPTFLDSLYDANADAFLYAKIDFQGTAIGTSNLWLVVNSKRVVPKVGSSPDVDIIFGANESTVLHGNDEYVRNVVPDGKLLIMIPGPGTLSLLALGGVMLIHRRPK